MSTRNFWRNAFRSRKLRYAQDVHSVEPGVVEPGVNDLSRAEAKSKTWKTTVTKVESWPEEARPLKKHDWISYLYLVGDIVLTVLPIYFILLSAAVVTLNGVPTKDNAFGSKVESAIQLGPTIFPIVFAAIIGRSMKMIARYLVERGAKLSTLELLMASQSVWGTVESQLLMKRLTLIGANLLFLWALSPLGGQASLRLLEKSSNSNQTSASLRYQSTGPGAMAWAMETYYVEVTDLGQVNPLYIAALLSPNEVKDGPEDAWGNVKIPRLESLNQSSADQDGWVTIPRSGLSMEEYYGLMGIPVIGRKRDQDARFNLESTQMTVQCEPFLRPNISSEDFSELERLVPGRTWQNMSGDNSPWESSTFFLQAASTAESHSSGAETPRTDAFYGLANSSRPNAIFEKRKITFASRHYDGDKFSVNIANCSMGQIHTETEVYCNNGRCSPVRIRKSRSDMRPETVTAFDHSMVELVLLESFPKALGSTRGSTQTEQFLFNTSSFPFVSPSNSYTNKSGWVDLSAIPSDVFSRRLSLVLNTYYQISLAPNAYMGTLPSNNFTLYGPDTLPGLDINAYLPTNLSTVNTTFTDWYPIFASRVFGLEIAFVGATANATMVDTQEVYACNFAWFAALLAATAIIFVTGAVSLILKRKTLAPEIFGFVASMTYENPYVKIPEGGSMLDAMERARLLKDVELYLADVRGNDDIGHIALAAGIPLRKLERGRLYS